MLTSWGKAGTEPARGIFRSPSGLAHLAPVTTLLSGGMRWPPEGKLSQGGLGHCGSLLVGLLPAPTDPSSMLQPASALEMAALILTFLLYKPFSGFL